MSDSCPINTKVVEIIKRYLEDQDTSVSPSSRLITDLGVDSLDLLDISFDLEQELSVSIPIDEWTANVEVSAEDFVEMLTVQRIVEYVKSEQSK